MAINMIRRIYCHYTKNLHEPRNLDVSVEIINLCIVKNTKLENTFIVPLQLLLVQNKYICHIQS